MPSLVAGSRTVAGTRHLLQRSLVVGQVGVSLVLLVGAGLALLHRGVIVRPMQAYCFPDCLRITVGTEAENERFLTELDSCLRELGHV
jgi:hypothetical protein